MPKGQYEAATSLASLITLTELRARSKQLVTVTLEAIQIFLLVLIIYFVLASGIAFAMRSFEARLARNLGR